MYISESYIREFFGMFSKRNRDAKKLMSMPFVFNGMRPDVDFESNVKIDKKVLQPYIDRLNELDKKFADRVWNEVQKLFVKKNRDTILRDDNGTYGIFFHSVKFMDNEDVVIQAYNVHDSMANGGSALLNITFSPNNKYSYKWLSK